MADDTPHGPRRTAEDSDRLAQLVHDLAVANDCQYPEPGEPPESGAPSRSEHRDESRSEHHDEDAGPSTPERR